jgi:hypothetical protein
MSKRAIIASDNNSEVIRNFHMQLLFFIYIVSDAMRRESAIADDYWHHIFKDNKNDRMEIALQNIEQK